MESTPGELLREVLGRTGTTPTELGRRLGYSTAYITVNRWINGRGFNAENQRKAAEALGLPSNYFVQPDTAANRERARLRIFAEFLHTEIGQQTTAEQRRILESTRFPGELAPSVNLYAAWALALQQRITYDQVLEVAAENDALDRELEQHRRRTDRDPPEKPPKSPGKPPRSPRK
jgi:transcriptional regulator with XRE-family HTH domain